MNTNRKGWDDMIKLRLRMSEKSDDDLRGILSRKNPSNPRRFANDAKTRKAAAVVLRVRGVLCEPHPDNPSTRRLP